MDFMTNELDNIDPEKIEKLNMKPRRNPITSDRHFADKITVLFDKFAIKPMNKFVDTNNLTLHDLSYQYITRQGSHNTCFWDCNEEYIIRISHKMMKEQDDSMEISDEEDEDEDKDNDEFINVDVKKADENMMDIAVKNDISPRVYMYGNVLINNKVHRYCITEAYDMDLSKFIKKHIYKSKVSENGYYKTALDVINDIVIQIENHIDTIIGLDIVYYDIKPENIVVNMNSIEDRISIKFIDWDSEFCSEEPWLKDNPNYKKAAKILNIITIACYMYRYYDHNIFNERAIELQDLSLLPYIHDLLFEVKSGFITIILHYFHKILGISKFEKDNFNYDDKKTIEIMKSNLLILMNKATKKFKEYI
jgi:hypothetical protein